MADIDEQIQELKNRSQAALSAKYRAVATKESAEKQLEQALAILRENFGLDNLSDARATLARIETKAQELIDKAEQKLDAMNL